MFETFRQSTRVLRSRPGFATLVALALGLGIGANTALFAVVNSLLLRPLPYRAADELVEIVLPPRRPPLADLRHAQSFSGIATFLPWGFNVTGPEGPVNTYGFRVSPNLFSVLGVQAALGRVAPAGETQPVVVLGFEYWRRTSSDPAVVGRTLIISGEPHTILGVLPADFALFVRDGNLFLPDVRLDVGLDGRTVARLKPGVTVAQARAEVAAIARNSDSRYAHEVRGADVIPLARAFRTNEAGTVLLLQATVGLVLLITCANVANLVFVRSTARRKEFAVRIALGAGRMRLFAQLMIESALLASAGFVLGLFVAGWSVAALGSRLPANVARTLRGAEALSIDVTVLGFTAGVSLLTTLIVGLAPAIGALREDVVSALREAGRNLPPRRQRLAQILVMGEIAVALMLLVGAGLTLKSLVGLQSAHLGFSADHVLRAAFELQQSRHRTAEQREAAMAQIVERCKGLPGVEAVGLLAPQFFPFGGPRVRGAVFAIEGRPEQSGRAEVYVANAEYFRAVRIPLLKGRIFSERDTASAPPVALISDVVARRHWGREDPIGSVIRLQADDADSPWVTVVGVVGDVRNPVGLDVQPTAYRPFAQRPTAGPVLMIRTAGDPMSLAEAVRREIRAVDPTGPAVRVADLQRAVWSYISPQRFTASAIGFFAALGVLLAAVGVYGVMRHWVSMRTFEIGVRVALGAQSRDVVRLVLGSAGKTTVAGVVMGLAGAIALRRVIAAQLYGVSPTDATVLLIVPAVMAAIALGAAFLPARWAASVNPVVALRAE